MAIFGCPHCKSADVRERNVAYASLRITDWNDDGTPSAFDSDEDAEWESCDTPRPLVCGDCGKEFGWDDVVPVCDCENPEPASGPGLVSESCPVHNYHPAPARD